MTGVPAVISRDYLILTLAAIALLLASLCFLGERLYGLAIRRAEWRQFRRELDAAPVAAAAVAEETAPRKGKHTGPQRAVPREPGHVNPDPAEDSYATVGDRARAHAELAGRLAGTGEHDERTQAVKERIAGVRPLGVGNWRQR